MANKQWEPTIIHFDREVVEQMVEMLDKHPEAELVEMYDAGGEWWMSPTTHERAAASPWHIV